MLLGGSLSPRQGRGSLGPLGAQRKRGQTPWASLPSGGEPTRCVDSGVQVCTETSTKPRDPMQGGARTVRLAPTCGKSLPSVWMLTLTPRSHISRIPWVLPTARPKNARPKHSPWLPPGAQSQSRKRVAQETGSGWQCLRWSEAESLNKLSLSPALFCRGRV